MHLDPLSERHGLRTVELYLGEGREGPASGQSWELRVLKEIVVLHRIRGTVTVDTTTVLCHLIGSLSTLPKRQ